MKIKSIEFKNFRKSEQKCSLSVEKQTVIVGKNNTAKTSVVEIMTKFLTNNSSFKFSDFNYKSIKKDFISALYIGYKSNEERINEKFPIIELNINIILDKDDNLAVLKELLYEFENNEQIILKCHYSIDDAVKIFNDFELYNEQFAQEEDKIEFYNFFEKNFANYYSRKFFSTKEDSDYLNKVESSYVYSLFNIFAITAQREVDDISDNEKMTLSNVIWNFYQDKKRKSTGNLDSDDLFKNAIEDIKGKLDETYSDYFSELIDVLNKEIVNDDKNKKLNIVSDFDIESLLKKNSKVKYFFDEIVLSESSNGLGYSNLLYIYIQLEAFKFDINANNAIFNIVFLEEPESHLHPQMQSVFLSKINKIFEESNIYSIISTHSSYVLQSSNINGINYFLNSSNGLLIKSLKDFIDDEKYIGLKNIIRKYFVINTCDLFFADKVIFIEGMAERILLPYIFENYDRLYGTNLCKQHISIFEVGGRHAFIFQDLVNFLEIKNLTITDIDSVTGNYNSKCPCMLSIADLKTTNPTIKNWFNLGDKNLFISDVKKDYNDLDKRINKNNSESLLTFQLPTVNEVKWGRTLEEEFIIENAKWIVEHLKNMESISNSIENIKKDYFENEINLSIDNITEGNLIDYCFEIVQRIDKSNFALDIVELNGWKIPTYIKEGLDWIVK